MASPTRKTTNDHRLDTWVQITYNTLRSAPDGDMIAAYDDGGFWTLDANLSARSANMLDGTQVQVGDLDLTTMLFTDIIVEADAEELP